MINASHLSDQFTMKNDCDQIVPKYIRSDVENCNIAIILHPLNWPPTIENLMRDETMASTSVILFMKNFSKHCEHTVLSKKWRLIESYASDSIPGVSSGEVLTPKSLMLGLDLHSITGQKNLYNIPIV